MACGSVRVWLALLPPLPVWKQNLPVLGDAASPPSGCVTTRMTVAMVRMRSVRPPALQTNSAVPACQGESKLTLVQQASFLCRLGRLMTEGLSSLNQLNQPCCKYYILSTPQNVNNVKLHAKHEHVNFQQFASCYMFAPRLVRM